MSAAPLNINELNISCVHSSWLNNLALRKLYILVFSFVKLLQRILTFIPNFKFTTPLIYNSVCGFFDANLFQVFKYPLEMNAQLLLWNISFVRIYLTKVILAIYVFFSIPDVFVIPLKTFWEVVIDTWIICVGYVISWQLHRS